eukprot:TRINITY_DN116007_c0_g1_i1.p1 TRINITY_DN116007_c0_g1~~TRINITY_DN116007_c0_g1_i1.p1  ORF type:complete len:399 (+),score=34.47 TRINITY_DN116007_c0_g1_i1:33-1229(+)
MSQPTYLWYVEVIGAFNLPKADRFSKTDGYVKARVKGNEIGKSKVVDNEFNPQWKWKTSFEAEPSTSLKLELYDKEHLKHDKFLGEANISSIGDITRTPPQEGGYYVLNVEIDDKFKAKSQGECTLRVRVSGIKSYHTVKTELLAAQLPGALFDDKKKHLYVPVTAVGAGVYAGVEFEEEGFDFKVFITQPNLACDICWTETQSTKIRRRSWKKPKQIVPGLDAYEELKMDDVPGGADLARINIFCFDRSAEPVHHTDLAKIVEKHGWQGAMNFNECRSKLKGVEFNVKEEEVIFPLEGEFAKLVVDFDDDNVDMKVWVCESPEMSTHAFDLTLSHQEVKKTSSIYSPPRIQREKYRVARRLELDDVPYGTAFKDMSYSSYLLSNFRQTVAATVISLH